MTAPRRWIDDAASAPDGALELLRAAEPTAAPTADALRRVADGVAQRSLAPPAPSLLAWKTLAVVVGVATLATVLWPVRTPRRASVAAVATRPAVVEASAPPTTRAVVVAADAGVAVVAREVRRPAIVRRRTIVAPAVVEPVAVAPAPTVATEEPAVGGQGRGAVAAPNELTREAAWLERARHLLATQPNEAAHLLRQHAAMFPRGQLGDEARYLTFEALRRAGRADEARAAGEAALAEQPVGLYAERYRRGLAAFAAPARP